MSITSQIISLLLMLAVQLRLHEARLAHTWHEPSKDSWNNNLGSFGHSHESSGIREFQSRRGDALLSATFPVLGVHAPPASKAIFIFLNYYCPAMKRP